MHPCATAPGARTGPAGHIQCTLEKVATHVRSGRASTHLAHNSETGQVATNRTSATLLKSPFTASSMQGRNTPKPRISVSKALPEGTRLHTRLTTCHPIGCAWIAIQNAHSAAFRTTTPIPKPKDTFSAEPKQFHLLDDLLWLLCWPTSLERSLKACVAQSPPLLSLVANLFPLPTPIPRRHQYRHA